MIKALLLTAGLSLSGYYYVFDESGVCQEFRPHEGDLATHVSNGGRSWTYVEDTRTPVEVQEDLDLPFVTEDGTKCWQYDATHNVTGRSENDIETEDHPKKHARIKAEARDLRKVWKELEAMQSEDPSYVTTAEVDAAETAYNDKKAECP